MTKKIRVLIVDDSAIVRDVLSGKLADISDIEIIGTAPDPFIARNKIVELNPDVITLDIEMPRMDGLTFLEKLMVYYPIPVIIVSSVTSTDSQAAIKALEIGAFDVVNKPGGNLSVNDIIDDITHKIRQAYSVKDFYVAKRKQIDLQLTKKTVKPIITKLSKVNTTDKLIAIGSSTGGTVALEYLLSVLPASMPPILIVQHMPPNFTKQFALRLNTLCKLTVAEAEENEIITNGHVYIAKGGYHLSVERKGSTLYCKNTNTPRLHYQKPAVDVLFESVAEEIGKNSIGVLLTGMGKDGAKGLLSMKNNGAYTLVQDENSSIVWGMPKTAIDLNAHREILSLTKIPERLIALLRS